MKNLRCVVAFLLCFCLSVPFAALCASAESAFSVVTDDYNEYYSALSELTARYKPVSTRASAEAAADSDDDYSLKRVIVQSSGGELDLSSFDALESIKAPDGLYILQFDSEAKARFCVKALRSSTLVRYAEPDIVVRLCEASDDAVKTEFSASSHLSWGPDYIKADDYADYLYDNGWSDSSATVAVVDSGVYNHSFLSGKILPNGKDLVDNDLDPSNDENSHGTHIAGIIVDCTKKLNVMLMPVRVLDRSGESTASMVAAGIRYAADNGADVINYSITGSHSDTKDSAVLYAVNKGVTVVCAAGNGNVNLSSYCPSHIKEAIVVGSIDQNGERSSFSNYGSMLDVVAPGGSVNSCMPGGGYGAKNGTSMATPFVSAIAAMYKIYMPSATPAAVETFIKESSYDLGLPGVDMYYGNGVPVLSAPSADGDYSFTVNEDGTATITGYNGTGTGITLPSVLSGKRVTAIGDNAFNGNTLLTFVKTSDTIRTIGNRAFLGCTALKSITISDSVTKIEDNAFFDCPLLSVVRLHARLDSIGSESFGYGSGGKADGFTVEGYTGTAGKSYSDANGFDFIESQQLQVIIDQEPFFLVSGFSDIPSYTIYPKNASDIITQWQSSNSAVIDTSSGFPFGKAAGTADVTLFVGSVTGSAASAKCTITVIESAFSLNKTSLSLYFKDTFRLVPTAYHPSCCAQDITFVSNNPEIARVTPQGTVTAVKRGTATVTAATADGKYTAVCMVTVDYTPMQWLIKILLFGWIWYKI